MGKFKVDLLTEKIVLYIYFEVCDNHTHLDFGHCPLKLGDGMSFHNPGTKVKPKIAMPSNLPAAKLSAPAVGFDSRKVSFFEQSPAVLPTTTDSGGEKHHIIIGFIRRVHPGLRGQKRVRHTSSRVHTHQDNQQLRGQQDLRKRFGRHHSIGIGRYGGWRK